jgi:type IV pilus assembly protein PilX
MAGSVSLRNQSFQGAEAALRVGESAVQRGGLRCRIAAGTFNALHRPSR